MGSHCEAYAWLYVQAKIQRGRTEHRHFQAQQDVIWACAPEQYQTSLAR
jgi:hypothetical protein